MFFKLMNKLKQPEMRYVWMLLYWLFMGMTFWCLELMGGREYHPVRSVLDDMIPFCKYFVFPYFFWFIYIIGTLTYFLFKDKLAFVKYMWSVIITHTLTLIIYFIYPTCQELRPPVEGNGFCESVINWLYGYDTNTNVCPSLHVIGACSVCFAALNSKSIKSRALKALFVIVCILICLSTVFIKQHSVIDLIAGAFVSAVLYPFVFMNNKISAALTRIFYIPEDDCVTQAV